MQTYLVGGAVRDKLLGYKVVDRDWVVVGASVQQMLDQGFQPVGADFPVFIHPVSGEEYALARTERKSGHGYSGFHYHASPDVTLEQDLLRRDLTINAMAEAPDGTLTDPYGGRQDLDNRILRHVSPAFAEDPLRVLRVARFAARYAHLGFRIAAETLELMRQLSTGNELLYLSRERVWQEFECALGEQSPGVFIDVLHRCQALAVLFAELDSLPDNARWPALAHRLPELRQTRERFAVLICAAFRIKSRDLDPEAIGRHIEDLCQRLKTPNLFRELALLVTGYCSAIQDLAQLNGDARLAVARGLDLLRRPERIPSLAQCFDCIGAWLNNDRFAATLPALNALHQALSAPDPKQLMQEGFHGKALGHELKNRQRDACMRIHFT